ncbi:MAG TPA: TetR/AcrR family transcriptional regulator [Solirubrobacterales bacterium]|nr:TetR/AcrR family transcriptional regulator [Solirubrobacterales bacterium]
MARRPEEVIAPTGGHGLPDDVVAERDRLFAATVEIVAKRGYRGATVERIAEAAEVDRATFHELFADKEGCFLAVFDRIVAESADAVARAAAAVDGWPEEVAAGIACLLDTVVADPQRARLALVEAQAAGPRVYSRYEEAIDRAAPKLRQGRAFNEDAAALSGALEEAILGGVTWIVHQRLARGEIDEIESLLDEAIQTVLSPYVGEGEARRLATTTLRDRSRRK